MEPGAQTQPADRVRDNLGRWAWALYDWANSPFTTLIITFIFPAYFAAAVVHDPVRAQVLWGYAMTGSGLFVTLSGPLLGAVADAGGARKPWLFSFTGLCILASGLLWFVRPDPAFITWAMICVALGNVGFEFGTVFNNAMLPDLVPEERVGRLSGWVWALGYLGGLAALGIVLLVFLRPVRPPFDLDPEAAEHVRILGPLVAVWLATFSLPLFIYTPLTGLPARPPSGRWRATAWPHCTKHWPKSVCSAAGLLQRSCWHTCFMPMPRPRCSLSAASMPPGPSACRLPNSPRLESC